jgi:hypothetical protein
VSIPFVQQFIVDGKVVPNDVMTTSAKVMLDELVRVSSTLRTLRQGTEEK